MFLLGHACWGYIIGRLVSYPLGPAPNLYLLLLLGMLPDIDLVLGFLDVEHRTVTHSIVFWSLAFAPVFVKYKFTTISYFAAVTQHILFGDLVVGSTNVLWPIGDLKIGLGIPILSPLNLILEAAGLAVFAAMILSDRKSLLAPENSRILAALVIFPLALFVFLASIGGELVSSILEAAEARHLERAVPSLLNNRYLQVATGLHLSLLLIVLLGLLKPKSSWIEKIKHL